MPSQQEPMHSFLGGVRPEVDYDRQQHHCGPLAVIGLLWRLWIKENRDSRRSARGAIPALRFALSEVVGELAHTLWQVGRRLNPVLRGGGVGAQPAREDTVVHLIAVRGTLDLADPVCGQFWLRTLAPPGELADGRIEVGRSGE